MNLINKSVPFESIELRFLTPIHGNQLNIPVPKPKKQSTYEYHYFPPPSAATSFSSFSSTTSLPYLEDDFSDSKSLEDPSIPRSLWGKFAKLNECIHHSRPTLVSIEEVRLQTNLGGDEDEEMIHNTNTEWSPPSTLQAFPTLSQVVNPFMPTTSSDPEVIVNNNIQHWVRHVQRTGHSTTLQSFRIAQNKPKNWFGLRFPQPVVFKASSLYKIRRPSFLRGANIVFSVIILSLASVSLNKKHYAHLIGSPANGYLIGTIILQVVAIVHLVFMARLDVRKRLEMLGPRSRISWKIGYDLFLAMLEMVDLALGGVSLLKAQARCRNLPEPGLCNSMETSQLVLIAVLSLQVIIWTVAITEVIFDYFKAVSETGLVSKEIP
ncbi:hypothetical protein NADFUDRAFT_41731 [Nadsonia fulvescens var. elongata DSM 6958]|uniref:Uncharacterized protein n=1 Tax=Nadsonia fulvescens var. elongata DSM 6958 TaxID=857566 RepID=A0A1E3PKB1_9ASCO|nr:hypothetical protein NADFUDRAFT_41731 [Nadsonia fulvescens var. elongata DSM 6958]